MKVRPITLIAILLSSLFLSLFAARVWSDFVYAKEQKMAYKLVAQLQKRRPQNVEAEVWKVATGWTITAYANVCFSKDYVSLDELRRFRVDLEKRLAGDVDLSTTDWIWQRLAETGPHGQQYRAKFEPEYRLDLRKE